MATGTLSPSPKQYVWSNTTGAPLAGGLIYTVAAGTSWPGGAIATYQDVALTVPNSNPIVLNSAGYCVIYLTSGLSYKFIVTDSVGGAIWTQDNISAVPASSPAVDVLGTAGENITAEDVVYLSDGSGSKSAGQWYKADADFTYASSTASAVGIALSAITASAQGSIRIGGQMPITLTSLTPGASYYVSATAGQLTATAPSNVRFVGGADGVNSIILAPNPPVPLLLADNAIIDGRLTLTTGVPVTNTDVTGATSVFWAPYRGNRVALYNGATWNLRTFSQSSIAVPSTTTSMYDIFLFDNAGVPTLELSAAWTSDTAIFGSGTFTTTRPTQDGVYVKSTNGTTVDATRRYIGTIRTTGVSGQTEDSGAKRYLSNYYNKVPRPMRILEATATWVYSTATWRQARASAANQLDFVIGYPEVSVKAHVQANAANDAGGVNAFVGIGLDSTTAPVAGTLLSGQGGWAASETAPLTSSVILSPAIGRHTLAWLEIATATGNTTWTGVSGTTFQSGIEGELSGA